MAYSKSDPIHLRLTRARTACQMSKTEGWRASVDLDKVTCRKCRQRVAETTAHFERKREMERYTVDEDEFQT